MDDKLIDTYTKHGELLADAARSFVRKSAYYKPKVEFKSDNSPVTNFDTELELVLRNLIRNKYPEFWLVLANLTIL